MVGVFVNKMTIPRNCNQCPLSMIYSYGCLRCLITKCDVTDCDGYMRDRHPNCPMKELVVKED